MAKCLMIEIKNKRFFTLIKNKIHLRVYCKTFGAKMMVVKANLKKEQILDLAKLVSALCDKNYKTEKVNIEVVKTGL